MHDLQVESPDTVGITYRIADDGGGGSSSTWDMTGE